VADKKILDADPDFKINQDEENMSDDDDDVLNPKPKPSI
jgi:hypothetical protein